MNHGRGSTGRKAFNSSGVKYSTEEVRPNSLVAGVLGVSVRKLEDLQPKRTFRLFTLRLSN